LEGGWSKIKQLFGSVALVAVAFSLLKAVNENSVGWGSVGVCLMIYVTAWGIGDQLTRALDRSPQNAVPPPRTIRSCMPDVPFARH
jgi:hypothetical protein